MNYRDGPSAKALALGVVAGVVVGCTGSNSPTTTSAPPQETTTQATVALPPPASSTTEPALQPGPHSWIADIDLPEATIPCTPAVCTPAVPSTDPSNEEYWRYSAPYDDLVEILREQFAVGRRYDAHGATWWKGLPPCYDENHQSPPRGWIDDTTTAWRWSDGSMALTVFVLAPGTKLGDGSILTFGRIDISKDFGPDASLCNRA